MTSYQSGEGADREPNRSMSVSASNQSENANSSIKAMKPGETKAFRYTSLFRFVFAFCLLGTCIFLLWYVCAISDLRFQIADTRVSLETSRQRENKQQYEYDRALEAYPAALETLDTLQPRADAARQQVDELKSTRKELRAEKKLLEERKEESAAASSVPENQTGDETP